MGAICVVCGNIIGAPHVCKGTPNSLSEKLAIMDRIAMRVVVEVRTAKKEVDGGLFADAAERLATLEEASTSVSAGIRICVGMAEHRASTGLVGADGAPILTNKG